MQVHTQLDTDSWFRYHADTRHRQEDSTVEQLWARQTASSVFRTFRYFSKSLQSVYCVPLLRNVKNDSYVSQSQTVGVWWGGENRLWSNPEECWTVCVWCCVRPWGSLWDLGAHHQTARPSPLLLAPLFPSLPVGGGLTTCLSGTQGPEESSPQSRYVYTHA